MRKTGRQLPITALACACLILPSGCAQVSSSHSNPPPPAGGITVNVSPSATSVRAGDQAAFTAAVSGTPDITVNWSVNSTPGGSASFGTIDSSGRYTAPASLPSPNTVTITAASSADPSATGSSSVTLLNPTPVLTAIDPAAVNVGTFTLTVTGSKFVSGAQVLLNDAPLNTLVNSATQLSATGNATTPGVFAVSVRNPGPGSSTSSSADFQVNGSTQASSCSSMSLGQGASLNGFRPFPDDNLWNTDISEAPVDANSAGIINFIGPGVGLHADFGAGQFQGSTIGIPYTVVDSSQTLIPINYTDSGDESDPGPMPIALNAPIEGTPNPGNGDRHVLVLDRANCFLYELFSSFPQTASWNAGSGAIWDLQADEQRPWTWTSADAAGLPIFPGLVRYDEVAAGQIRHAIRFTLQSSKMAFTPPASHWAANSSNANAAPMGMRMRLKASFDVSGFSAANQVILNAMKKYGIIMADNGSSMFISGAPDDRWDNDDLHNLGAVTASDFEVVAVNPVYTPGNLPQGAAPKIASFTPSAASISAGASVTLSWQVSGAEYVIVSPLAGVVRGTSVVVRPATTTTFTLYATNEFGRTASTVIVTVR